jgi:hypothetical protein
LSPWPKQGCFPNTSFAPLKCSVRALQRRIGWCKI